MTVGSVLIFRWGRSPLREQEPKGFREAKWMRGVGLGVDLLGFAECCVGRVGGWGGGDRSAGREMEVWK